MKHSIIIAALVAVGAFFIALEANARPADRYTDHTGPNRYTNSYTKHYIDGDRGYLRGYVRAGKPPTTDIRNDSMTDNNDMPGLNDRRNDRDNKSRQFMNYRQNRVHYYQNGYNSADPVVRRTTHGVVVTEPVNR